MVRQVGGCNRCKTVKKYVIVGGNEGEEKNRREATFVR